MFPRIETLTEKKLVGLRQTMSLADNKTAHLWRSFMPRRKEITNSLTADLISLQNYSPNHFTDFKPTNEFEKWAGVEVTDFSNVPDDMETYTLAGGLYAVFDYQGLSDNSAIFQYIFGTWLPNSDYRLDNRPHFEILGEKYRNNDAASEEQIWVPIKPKEQNIEQSKSIVFKAVPLTLIGITLPGKTSNLNGQSSLDCGKLWARFSGENILLKIPDRISDDIYAVYYDYEGDHTKPFRYFIGCSVKDDAIAEDGFHKLTIPEGDYMKVVAKGKMPECIANAWREIWQSQFSRTYRFDFEVYGPQSADWNNATVPIFLS